MSDDLPLADAVVDAIWRRHFDPDARVTRRPRVPRSARPAAGVVAALQAELSSLKLRVEALERGRAGLECGRRNAIAAAKRRGAASAALVLDLALADAQAGHLERGRAGRIARKLHGGLSESQVRKIIVRALSSASDSMPQDGGNET